MRLACAPAVAGLVLLVWTAPAAAEAPAVIGPLHSDGYLWAAPPCPTPTSQLRFQFDFNYHADDFNFWWAGNREVTFSSIQFLMSGEYTFIGALTAGLDVPFLMIYDVSSEDGNIEDSGVDFGNIRLHLRYAFEIESLGLVITPAFRVWLPTNTFLEVDWEFLGRDQTTKLIRDLAIFEPMVSAAWASRWLSVMLATGPKFLVIDGPGDYSMWGIDLVAGTAPISSLPALEFVLELNMLIEMDDDMIHSGNIDDTGVPLALGLGVRYRFGDFQAELAFRIGLHQAEAYYGDFNLGLTVGWLFSG